MEANMTRTLIAIVALLSLSSAALAYGGPPTVSRQEIARAEAATMHHDPADRYVRNANNCGMELSRAVSGPSGAPLGYACYSNSN
jgi:hypothetical protein